MYGNRTDKNIFRKLFIKRYYRILYNYYYFSKPIKFCYFASCLKDIKCKKKVIPPQSKPLESCLCFASIFHTFGTASFCHLIFYNILDVLLKASSMTRHISFSFLENSTAKAIPFNAQSFFMFFHSLSKMPSQNTFVSSWTSQDVSSFAHLASFPSKLPSCPLPTPCAPNFSESASNESNEACVDKKPALPSFFETKGSKVNSSFRKASSKCESDGQRNNANGIFCQSAHEFPLSNLINQRAAANTITSYCSAKKCGSETHAALNQNHCFFRNNLDRNDFSSKHHCRFFAFSSSQPHPQEPLGDVTSCNYTPNVDDQVHRFPDKHHQNNFANKDHTDTFISVNEREGIQNLLLPLEKEKGVDCVEKIMNLFTSYPLISNKIRIEDFIKIFEKLSENVQYLSLNDVRFSYLLNSFNEENIMQYASKQQIITFMECFEILGLRNALREASTFLYKFLEASNKSCLLSTNSHNSCTSLSSAASSSNFPEDADIQMAVYGLSLLGNSFIFYSNLFDFCDTFVSRMSCRDLSTYVYECGRHGLRCKHYLDNCFNMCCANANKMNLSEIMKCANGFIRFAREYSKFYVEILSYVSKKVNELNIGESHLVLRFCKENRTQPKFYLLQNSVAAHLIDIMHTMNIAQACRCLSYIEYHPNSKEKVKELVHKILHKMNYATDLSESLSVKDVVDAIDCFASWELRTILLNKLGDILVNRISEVKFSSNISLWLIAFDGFSKAGWYHLPYIHAACSIARDDYMLDRLSIFQQGRFVCCLSKLHHYEYDIYNNIADRLANELHLFKNVREISSILSCYSNANHIHFPLFNAAYKNVTFLIDSQTLDLSNNSVANSIISLCWSFVVANFHNYDTFPSILDYAFFNKDPENRFGFKRLHQIADACFLENYETANKCQFKQIMEAYTTHENCKIMRHAALNIKYDKDAEILRNKVAEEFSNVLNQLNIQHDLCANLDKYSPYVVEIQILSAPKGNEKFGFFIQGRNALMRTGDEGKWLYTNTGSTALMERTLKIRGWTLGRISLSDWLSMRTLDHKKEFTINKLTQLGLDVPFATF